jgi:DNA-binding transcriptional ArsR family regulator
VTALAANLGVLDRTASAAAVLSPERLRLVRELAEPATAAELAKRLGETRQRLNYHLRELEKAGVVRLVEERKKRGLTERVVVATATAYVVSPDVLGPLAARPEHVHDRLSSAYQVAICAQAIRDLGELRGRAERAGKQLPTLTVQTDIRFASAADMNAAAEELASALAAIAHKYHRDQTVAPDGRLFTFVLAGRPAITKPEDPAPSAGPRGRKERPQ